MITIIFNSDRLLINRPFEANAPASIANWCTLVRQALAREGVEADLIDQAIIANWLVLPDHCSIPARHGADRDGDALTAKDVLGRVTAADWYDYSPREDDRW